MPNFVRVSTQRTTSVQNSRHHEWTPPVAMPHRALQLLGLLHATAALHPHLRAVASPRHQRHAPCSVRMDEARDAKITKLEATLAELDAAGIDPVLPHMHAACDCNAHCVRTTCAPHHRVHICTSRR